MNPWNNIALEDYEKHMCFESVQQLQQLNEMMKCQIASCNKESIMILGVTGGNGLEYINPADNQTVYGIDINDKYLQICRERYPDLQNILHTCHIDAGKHPEQLPQAKHLLANLFIEYVGISSFQKIVSIVMPDTISCIIQVNGINAFVSHTPYENAFEQLDQIAHVITEEELTDKMQKTGYVKTARKKCDLPNKKQLVQLDYRKTVPSC